MPVIVAEELNQNKDNKVLQSLANQSIPFAIVPDQENQGDVFYKDYVQRKDFTILKQKYGKVFAGNEDDVDHRLRSCYSQTLFQTLIAIISGTLYKNNEKKSLMPQKCCQYMINSMYLQPEVKYISSLIDFIPLISIGMGEFILLKNIKGCVEAHYSYSQSINVFKLEKIIYIGNKNFEIFIEYTLTGNPKILQEFDKLLNNFENIEDEDALNIEVQKLSYNGSFSGENQLIDFSAITDLIYSHSFEKTFLQKNSIHHKKSLSLKRLELADFIINALNRLKINKKENTELVSKLMKIFIDINNSLTKDYGSFYTGKGKLNDVLTSFLEKNSI